MDRSSRTAILEPIMLILKQRTGVASIVAVAITIFMLYKGFSVEQVAMTVTPIFVYIGKQTVIDSKEISNTLTKEVMDVLDVLDETKKDLETPQVPTEVKDNG